MHFLLWILMVALWVSYSRPLVYKAQFKKGANGCLTAKGEQLQVGQFVQDNNTCGVIRCEGRDGKALIMYCQIPLPFAQCSVDYISTAEPFPRCCWTCVHVIDCY
ncbi:uncharacterized protein LOC110180860 [Drosophila serrata]|uniref:uncharacterized protein LOC110180860 n=1 Tax=Drosophila serrata TaxID=7274 RepID=UPI000A1D35CC|nr:uncharacterized protein LOC110180860 [Drosophila serrata]